METAEDARSLPWASELQAGRYYGLLVVEPHVHAGPLRSAADSWLRRLRGPARPVLVDDGDDDKHEAKQPKTIRP